MPHAELVATLTFALGGALIGGAAARRLGFSPIMGYLLAGIAVGPHGTGLIADAEMAGQLAEIGVVLLMFGVGLHFSPHELSSVKAVAVPGALVQAAVATGFGIAIGLAWGFSFGGGLVLGLAVSVASTVVLMRGLIEHGLDRSTPGRLAIGWLIVEDLLTVVVLVMLPALAPSRERARDSAADILVPLAITLLIIFALVALVLIVGRRVVPWFLDGIARLRSRELFTLAVLALALGIAYGVAELTGVSMALGAFLAGMVVGQSDLSHEAAAEALPLRDAFAVLFFVSVGILFDPALIAAAPWLTLATLGLVLLVKPAIAMLIVLVLRHTVREGLTVAVGLAQIGEFSFIVAAMGRELGLLPAMGESVLLAVALVSIAVNPLLFRLIEPVDGWLRARPKLTRLLLERPPEPPLPWHEPPQAGHVVLCGHGRIGAILSELLAHRGDEFVVIEQDRRVATSLRAQGLRVVSGDASNAIILEHAGVARARALVVGFADPVATRLAVDHALAANATLRVLARASSADEERFLRRHDRVGAVVGEREAALEIARLFLLEEGVGPLEIEALVMDLRHGDGVTPRERGTRLTEVRVPEGSPVAGRRLRDLGLPAGARVVLYDRGGDYAVPHGSTTLQAGDRLVVLADEHSLEALHARLAS